MTLTNSSRWNGRLSSHGCDIDTDIDNAPSSSDPLGWSRKNNREECTIGNSAILQSIDDGFGWQQAPHSLLSCSQNIFVWQSWIDMFLFRQSRRKRNCSLRNHGTPGKRTHCCDDDECFLEGSGTRLFCKSMHVTFACVPH